METPTFENNVKQIWGKAGEAWLKNLPNIVAILEKKWELRQLQQAPNLSYNYIVLGYQHTMPIALKIGFEHKAIKKEATALSIYNGHGCVQLLDICFEQNALLLERAIPGTSLKSLFPDDDDKALEHTAIVMQQLHSVPVDNPKDFKTIQDWLKLLDTPPAVVANNYHVHEARALAHELVATQTMSVLLHGDLHHDNILQAGDRWIAIDPKGVLGEPAYEIGAFIRNPYPLLLEQSNPGFIMHKHLKLFAELLGCDRERLHAWSYVQAVLAGCWAIQDGQTDVEMAMVEAELLQF